MIINIDSQLQQGGGGLGCEKKSMRRRRMDDFYFSSTNVYGGDNIRNILQPEHHISLIISFSTYCRWFSHLFNLTP